MGCNEPLRPADLAIVHDLPQAGGAFRVVAEYIEQRPQHRFTVYTRMPAPAPGDRLVALPARVVVRRFPLPETASRVRRLWRLRELPRLGRELAATIDAAAHDAVFVHPSQISQSHEVLPFLRTPSLFHAAEALRSAYEQMPLFGRPTGPRERVIALGLDPYERTRKRLDRTNMLGADRVVTDSRFTADSLRAIYGVHA